MIQEMEKNGRNESCKTPKEGRLNSLLRKMDVKDEKDGDVHATRTVGCDKIEPGKYQKLYRPIFKS